MNHKGTQTIRTNRLILRKFTLDDANAMFNNWANDDTVTKYLTWQTHNNISVTRTILKTWVADYVNNDFYQWGIEYDGVLIGSIGGHKPDENLKAISFGYCIGKEWWGLGLVSEALQAVIDYWFDIGFNRIWGVHYIDNFASGRVMEKCGLKYEGIVRQGHITLCGDIHDVKQYAIVASDRNQS